MPNEFKKQIKFLVGMFAPYSLVKLWQRRAAQHREQTYREQFAAHRAQEKLAEQAFTYDGAVLALQEWGLDPVEVIGGSIPPASLELCGKTIDQHFGATRPLVGLHIGNFVGVSVCFFLEHLAARNVNSLLISIDPNITHRAISNPQQYVTRLAARFGLTKHHLLVTGYTLEKNVAQYDVKASEGAQSGWAQTAQETAPENVLLHLAQLGVHFDFAVIDGNHDAAYLAREVAALKHLLADPALLILDDVNEHWDRIETFFTGLALDNDMTLVAQDTRLGILFYRKQA